MIKNLITLFLFASTNLVNGSLFEISSNSIFSANHKTIKKSEKVKPPKKLTRRKFPKVNKLKRPKKATPIPEKKPFKEGSIAYINKSNTLLLSYIIKEFNGRNEIVIVSDEENFDEELKKKDDTFVPQIDHNALLQKLENKASQFELDEKTKNKALQIYFYLINKNPEKCLYYYKIGSLYHSMGLIELSQQFLLKTLEICPEYIEAIEILNDFHNKNISCSMDNEAFKRLFKKLEAIGNIYEREPNNHKKALAIYTFLYQQDPSNCSYAFYLGKIHYTLKNTEEAKKYFIKTLEICPFNIDAIDLINEINRKKEPDPSTEVDYDKTLLTKLESFARQLEQDPLKKEEAIKIYKFLLCLQPKNCDYLYYLGKIYASLKRMDEAEFYLFKSLEFCPENLDVIDLLNETQKRKCCPLEERTEISKASISKLETLGKDLLAKKNYEKSEAVFKLLSKLNANQCSHFIELGKIYAAKNEFELARGLLLKALSLCPESIETISLLNEIYSKNFNKEEENQENIKINEGLEKFAQELQQDSNFEDAIKVYKLLLYLFPKNPLYFYELGKIYYSLKRFDDSDEYLSKSLDLFPQNIQVIQLLNKVHLKDCCHNEISKTNIKDTIFKLERLGDTLLKDKNYEEALEVYLLLSYLNKSNCFYPLNLGKIYKLLNKVDVAKNYLLQTLIICSENLDAIKLLNDLNKSSLKDFQITEEERSNLEKKLIDYAYKLEQSKETQEDALKIYELLLMLDPQNSNLLFMIGNLLHSMGKTDESLNYLFYLLQLNPDNFDVIKLINTIKKKAPKPLDSFSKEKLIETLEIQAKDLEKKNQNKKAKQLFLILTYLEPNNCDYYYFLGLLNYKLKNKGLAKENLMHAIDLCPEYSDAIDLLKILNKKDQFEEKKRVSEIDDGYNLNTKEVKNEKSAFSSLEFLELQAKIFNKKNETKHLSHAIYEELILIDPKNCDYLYQLGNYYHFKNEDCKAISFLNKCLFICPDYYDAADLLGKIYLKKKKYKHAILLYQRYCEKAEAREALAKIAFLKGNFIKMEKIYKGLLCENSEEINYLLGFSRALYNRRYFFTAKPYLLEAISQQKCASKLISEYVYDVKPYTNPSIIPEFSYTKGKENDPSLDKPVVRDIYVTANLNILYPINDYFHVDVKTLFFNQKEIDIYEPKGLNYDAFLIGGQIKTRTRLCSYWHWDLGLRFIEATGRKKAIFPFHQTNNFEPSTYFFYNGYSHFFSLGGHYESFIIKNFSKQRSQIQRLAYSEVRYGYKVRNTFFEPRIEGWVSRSFYQDSLHNRKNLLAFLTTAPIPFFNRKFLLNWYAEYSGFEKLSRNYTSYKRQWKNILGVTYRHDISPCSYLELAYEEKWQSSRDIFMPVGDTVFVAPNLFIRGYKPMIKFGYRYRDTLTFIIGGHYYRDTFPYRDYNINTNIIWYF